MKFFPVFVLAACASMAVAQDAAKPELRGAAPTLEGAAPAPAAPTNNDPLGLIPETLEPAPKPKGEALNEPQQKLDKTTAAADELNARIKLRELKTKIEREPKMVAQLEAANNAKTDYEKREGLRAYYKALYGKIEKLNPSLKKQANLICVRLTHNLDQTRISPTEPPDPNEPIRPE